MRSSIASWAAAALLALAVPARAADIVVPMDEARIISFPRPVATIFMANPVVADINIIDSTHAFVLGKGFGATNLIALDSEKNIVSTSHVSVFGSHHLLTLNRGAQQFTYACATARCETFPAPGDVKGWHDDTMGEIEKREDMGGRQASPTEGH